MALPGCGDMSTGLRNGQMHPDAIETILWDSATSLAVDAAGGMGAPVSIRTMDKVIEKAGKYGMAFGTV